MFADERRYAFRFSQTKFRSLISFTSMTSWTLKGLVKSALARENLPLAFETRYQLLANRLCQWRNYETDYPIKLLTAYVSSFRVRNIYVSKLQEVSDKMRGFVESDNYSKIRFLLVTTTYFLSAIFILFEFLIKNCKLDNTKHLLVF